MMRCRISSALKCPNSNFLQPLDVSNDVTVPETLAHWNKSVPIQLSQACNMQCQLSARLAFPPTYVFLYGYRQCLLILSTPFDAESFTNFVPWIVFGEMPSSTHLTNAASTLLSGSYPVAAGPDCPIIHAPGPPLQWHIPLIRKYRKKSSTLEEECSIPLATWL